MKLYCSNTLPLSRVEQSTTLIKEQFVHSFFYMSNDWLEKKTLHDNEWYEKENTKQYFFIFFVTSSNLQREKHGFALESKPQVNRKWWLRAGLWHPYSKKNLTPLAAPLNPAVLLIQKAHIRSFRLSQSDATGTSFVRQWWNVFPSLLICTFIIHQKYLFSFSSVSILGYEALIQNSYNILHPWCFVPTTPQL